MLWRKKRIFEIIIKKSRVIGNYCNTPNGPKHINNNEKFTILNESREDTTSSSMNRVSTLKNNGEKIIDLTTMKEKKK